MYMLDTHSAILTLTEHPANLLRLLEAKREEGIYISSITLAELEYNEKGSSGETGRIPLKKFLAVVGTREFDGRAAREYGAIKRELKTRNAMLKPLNLLVGAHAKSLGMTLITDAPREFAGISGLRTEDWF